VDALTYAIARSCEIKATVVARDEREQNLRAILNFGHTFGHAIEAATGYETYLHGEAVGLGMLIAADLSPPPRADRLGYQGSRPRDPEKKPVCPPRVPRIGAARALDLMHMDKESAGRHATPGAAGKTGTGRRDGRLHPGRARCHGWRSISLERSRRLRGSRRALARAPLSGTENPPTVSEYQRGPRPASSIPPLSAAWSTRPRFSSIMKGICTETRPDAFARGGADSRAP